MKTCGYLRAVEASSSGFTLIQLLTVMAVLAFATFVAIPGFDAFLYRNQIEAETRRMFHAISLTRQQAIGRNTTVSMCPLQLQERGSPSCGGTYSNGWIVFSNPDKDREIDIQTDSIIRLYEPLPAGFSVTNRAGTREETDSIHFLPDGTSRRNRTLLICSPRPVVAPGKAIVMNRVGRPRRAIDWGTCPG